MLEWPSDLDDAERAHVKVTISKWASALAEDRLPVGRIGEPVPHIGARVRLAKLELVRDEHWMMTGRRTIRSWCAGRRRRTGGKHVDSQGRTLVWSGLSCEGFA